MLLVADLPEPGQLVDVVLGAGAGQRIATGRVTQLRPPGLVVELPVDLPADGPLELTWLEAAGVRALSASVTMRWISRTGVRWQVAPEGPSRPGNRRDAVRGPLRLRVQLTDRATGIAHRGRTVDLSETGLRCLLTPSTSAPVPGATVDVGVTLRGAVFPLSGRLHRVDPDETGWDAVVAFTDVCASMADLVRAQVFACLREQRRLGL